MKYYVYSNRENKMAAQMLLFSDFVKPNTNAIYRQFS